MHPARGTRTRCAWAPGPACRLEPVGSPCKECLLACMNARCGARLCMHAEHGRGRAQSDCRVCGYCMDGLLMPAFMFVNDCLPDKCVCRLHCWRLVGRPTGGGARALCAPRQAVPCNITFRMMSAVPRSILGNGPRLQAVPESGAPVSYMHALALAIKVLPCVRLIYLVWSVVCFALPDDTQACSLRPGGPALLALHACKRSVVALPCVCMAWPLWIVSCPFLSAPRGHPDLAVGAVCPGLHQPVEVPCAARRRSVAPGQEALH